MDTEDEGYSNVEKSDLGPGRSRTKKETPLQKLLKEIHWNKEEEDRLQAFYENDSRGTLKRKRNATKALKKKPSNLTILLFFGNVIAI